MAGQRLGFDNWDMLLFARPTYAANAMGSATPVDVPVAPPRWRFDGAGLMAGLGSDAQYFPTVGWWGGDIGLIGFTSTVGVRR